MMKIALFLALLLGLVGVILSQTCSCGNGVCEGFQGEDCRSCPRDCGVCPSCDNYCGNLRCELNETACSCPTDCGFCCLDGMCLGKETFLSCPDDCAGYLHGLTVEADNYQPISVGSVTCSGMGVSQTAVMNPKGEFTVGALEPGYYTCVANVPNHIPNTENFEVRAGFNFYNFTKRITLQKVSSQITGRTWVGNGYLNGVNVSCSGASSFDRLSGSDGTFFFANVTPGAYQCTGSLLGYTSASVTLSVVRGSARNIDLMLTPILGTVRGVVIDQDKGTPVFNASVACRMLDNNQLQAAGTSDAAGSFVLSSIGFGNYVCSASKPEYVVGMVTGRFTQPAQNQNVRIVVRRFPATLRGLISGPGVQSLPNASIRCLSTQQSLTTLANGSPFFFPTVIPENFNCTASAPGFGSQSLNVVAASGAVTSFNFNLAPLAPTPSRRTP